MSQYFEGINHDWLNGWECWTVANKTVYVEEEDLTGTEGHLKCIRSSVTNPRGSENLSVQDFFF